MSYLYDKAKRHLEDHQKLLDQEKENKKLRPNARMEEDTPDIIRAYDFWCDVCEIDFTSPAYKTKHRLFGDTVAVYRTKCPECEQECIRLITHKDHDRYYQQSDKVRRQRNQYAFEMLQPHEYGFNTFYGESRLKFRKRLENREVDIMRMENKDGLRGRSLEAQRAIRVLHAS